MESELIDYLQSLLERTSEYLVDEGDVAYIRDPIFGIVRNRVTAEYLKAVVRLDGQRRADVITKLTRFLLSRQNPNGSWNEIHPNYNQESALVTSFVGEALLLALPHLSVSLKNDVEDALIRARNFVLSSEIEGGYFLKSKLYRADYLNVDATCGAFLASYYETFGDDEALNGAIRAARRVCGFQEEDGSFPYTVTSEEGRHHLRVPCIHYQGVTLYYLSKIHEVVKESWLEKCILRGVRWLSLVQKGDGRFDWSKSGLMFAYYLTGAYAFGIASFMYASKLGEDYLNNAEIALSVLKDNTPDIVLRWERGRWRNLPADIVTSLKSSLIGDYPFTHRLFRFGYALYRQIARRRFSRTVSNDVVFQIIRKLLHMNVSTVEPFSNFPDMFMTSEVLDSLSHALRLL